MDLIKGDAHRQIIRERHIEHALSAHQAIVAKFDAARGAKFLRRIVGNQIDSSGRGAATVERTLRAAQHFDAIHVKEIQATAIEQDAVFVDSDGAGGIGRRCAQAPNGNVGRSAATLHALRGGAAGDTLHYNSRHLL